MKKNNENTNELKLEEGKINHLDYDQSFSFMSMMCGMLNDADRKDRERKMKMNEKSDKKEEGK